MRAIRFVHRFLVAQTAPRWAVAYSDRLTERIADFYFGPLCDEVLQRFPGPARLLDVGTGTGHLPTRLALANPAYRISAIDLSTPSLRLVARRAASAGVANRVQALRADVIRDAADLGSFDLVLSTCSLHHWRWPAAMLKGMAARVAPEGEIWLMDDSCEVSDEARSAWVARVEQAASAGALFRRVFRFESRHLAYSRAELEQIATAAGVAILDFHLRDVFFVAKLKR